MAAKHQTPQYKRNARIIRQRVHASWRRDEPVLCWRPGCQRGRIIPPGSRFDVGHLPGAMSSALYELAPEHVRCNREEGGRLGAKITNSRRTVVVPTGAEVETWPI